MLLYCMIEADAPLEIGALPPGVCETNLDSLQEGGVRCLYSRMEKLPANAESFRSNALQFHGVLRAILNQASIVPFRFPTLLETDREIRKFIASHAPGYLEDLRRFRGKVQMEVRIKSDALPAEPQSGKQYMEAKLSETRTLTAQASAVFAAAHDLIADWQVRQDLRGLRCFALVPREQVIAFEERLRTLPPVAQESIVVSGPWPPSEFLHVRNP